jgi:fatty acid desaturase
VSIDQLDESESGLAGETDHPPHRLAPNFSLAETRKLVSDLFEPKPWIYWTDFLLSWGLGVVCFRLVREFPFMSRLHPWQSLLQIGLFLVSGLLFYRAGIFTHELVHLRPDKFKAFRVVWNLLAGIPFLIPSFTYYSHIDHHRRKNYGTQRDGEYLPFGATTPWAVLFYLGQNLIVPLAMVVRFGLLTPLTWISPTLRDEVHRRLSSMVADPRYIRPLPSERTLKIIRLQEILCFLFLIGAGLSMYFFQRPPTIVLLQAYLTTQFVMLINSFRTLAAHRYRGQGQEMSFMSQLLDSVNFSERNLLAPLWAPLGLKYHALHHLFPTLPYHAMGQAHRRLMRELPADSPYRQTEEDSLPATLVKLWRASTAAAKRRKSQRVREEERAVA